MYMKHNRNLGEIKNLIKPIKTIALSFYQLFFLVNNGCYKSLRMGIKILMPERKIWACYITIELWILMSAKRKIYVKKV